AELLPYDHEHVELSSSTVRIANQSVSGRLQFKVSGMEGVAPGTGQVEFRAQLHGTRGTGEYHGQFAGAPVQGTAHAAVSFDHATPVGAASLRIWLPDLANEIRGILLWGNGAGGDSRIIVLDERLQAFAAAHRLAIVGTCRFGAAMRHGEGQRLLDSLRAFADITEHREVAHAPILFSGHSNGGQMAYEFNAWMPSRVIAFSVWRGGVYESYQGLSPESVATPAVLSAGERDAERRILAIRKLFEGNRPLGANWSFLVEENTGHERGSSLTLFLLTFQSALQQRLPRHASFLRRPVVLRPVHAHRAWLADNATWKSGITAIHEAHSFAGDPKPFSWLLDQDNAYIYRGLASYANPLKLERLQHSPTYRADEPVVLECTAFSGAPWTSVAVYDGSRKVGMVTPDHPQFALKGPHKPGAHAAVLVGELPGGALRTSLPVDWVVWPPDRTGP
ncbi:MAG: hypothetical protein NTY38_33855, partial [Acidobacteria bacterium]|nr:hypothetical protein [Acidobacteriota bacterium]